MENGRSVRLKNNFHKLAWYFRRWQIFFCKEPDASILGFVGQQVSVATSQPDQSTRQSFRSCERYDWPSHLERIVFGCTESKKKTKQKTSYGAAIKSSISEVDATQPRTPLATESSAPIPRPGLSTLFFRPLWLCTHRPEEMQPST